MGHHQQSNECFGDSAFFGQDRASNLTTLPPKDGPEPPTLAPAPAPARASTPALSPLLPLPPAPATAPASAPAPARNMSQNCEILEILLRSRLCSFRTSFYPPKVDEISINVFCNILAIATCGPGLAIAIIGITAITRAPLVNCSLCPGAGLVI